MNRETVIRKERKMKELLIKADSERILDENEKRTRDNQNELLRDNKSFSSILIWRLMISLLSHRKKRNVSITIKEILKTIKKQ